MGSTGPEARKTAARGVCAVLTPRDAGHVSAPRELMDAMHERGMDPILCKDEFEVMALLVRRERDRRSGTEPAPTVALVLGSADSARAAALFHSAAAHAPHAAFWHYDVPSRRLVAFAPPAPVRAPAFGELVVRRGAVRKASLRLAGESVEEESAVRDAPPATPAQPPRKPFETPRGDTQNREASAEVDESDRARGPSPAALTDEELNMLLADDR